MNSYAFKNINIGNLLWHKTGLSIQCQNMQVLPSGVTENHQQIPSLNRNDTEVICG